jgi:sec-independent protein translocase protein TatB
MFEISWSEILVIGIVALIVVGPKELPTLLRTVGKYMGMIRKQATEFRAQFDEAMRESEFEQLRKDVQSIKTDAEATLRDTERAVKSEFSDVKRELDGVTDDIKYDPAKYDHTTSQVGDATANSASGERHDANGLPMPHETVASNGASTHHEPAATVPPPSGAAAAAAAAAAASLPHEPAKSPEPAKLGA